MGMKILDCTLRDGAYVVDSKFGFNNIRDIITCLSLAGIDIIECGWLRDYDYGKDSVFYRIPKDIEQYLPSKKSEYSLMFDYGRYDVTQLPKNDGIIDIIRIAFYKKNIDNIPFVAEYVKNKGYKVFLQPSNIMEYSDKEINKLCTRANHIGVDSVYIVDSFGSMFTEDLEIIIQKFVSVLNSNIRIGFHSHNSIQMSLALTIEFIKMLNDCDVYVDASLAGMGRGAGNTKTELLTEYLNRNGYSYDTSILWKCIQKNIIKFYDVNNWEYSPEKGYRGINNLHPNAEIQ